MRSDGTDPTLLARHNLDPDELLNATQPTWLPDGTGVSFVRVSGNDYGTASMWAIDADGSNVRAFPDGLYGGGHPRLRPVR